MQISSRTRQLYNQLLNRKATDIDKTRVIEAANDFKALKRTAGWGRVDEFISKQREGQRAFMEHEVQLKGFGILFLFNTFVKYIFLLIENRAYTKLEQMIEVTIHNGERYAAERAKAAERERQKTS